MVKQTSAFNVHSDRCAQALEVEHRPGFLVIRQGLLGGTYKEGKVEWRIYEFTESSKCRCINEIRQFVDS